MKKPTISQLELTLRAVARELERSDLGWWEQRELRAVGRKLAEQLASDRVAARLAA